MKKKLKFDEDHPDFSKHLEKLTGEAFKKARQEALDAGLTVLVSENDKMIRLYPDGRREFVMDLPPRKKLPKNFTLTIR